ncbi:hypothetical protein E8E14_005594 [Neopestalotiopsis sp. 37M]|nr:hypothetical protein E8E14_005594 [Neopestalotiopsis sp. 37M]
MLRIVQYQAGGEWANKHSLSTYETKLRDVLGLRKNLTPKGWLAIGQRIRGNENREWEVHINGRKVSRRKVMKEIGRYEKREPSLSKNLPMPQEARIEWRNLGSFESVERSIGGCYPQQNVLSALDDSVSIHPRNEDLEMTEFDYTISVRSPSDILNETEPLSYNRSGIIDQMIDIAVSARTITASRFHATIPDPRFKELCEPALNDLPFYSFKQNLDRIFHNYFASGLDAELLSNSQTAYRQIGDAAHSEHSSNETRLYGVSSHGDAASTVSTGFDALQVLGRVVYHFSNHLKELEETEETMRLFIENAPLSFVGEVLQAGLLVIEESWMKLAEWSFELGAKEFFEQVMKVSLSCPEWVDLNGVRCFALAANLGCSQVVRAIIECGVSPNSVSTFSVPHRHSGTTPGFSRLAAVGLCRARGAVSKDTTVLTCPVLEAAVRGRHDILGILKDAHVDFQLRLDGLTVAGHVVSAHQNGLIDMDDLSSALSFLVSMGENVDAPMRLEGQIVWSDETLLDAIYLGISSSSLFQKLEKLSQVPHGVLTVSGILQSAENGQDALRNYLTTIIYPIGLPRKRIEEIALARSFQLPKAFESMMREGFALEFKTLNGQGGSPLGDWCANTLPLDSYSSDTACILYGLRYFPTPVAQYVVDHFTEDELFFHAFTANCRSIAALVPKLSADQIQRLGTKLFARAMKLNDRDAVEACLQAGVSVGEVNILALAESGKLDHSALRVLHDHGARLALSLEDLKCVSLDVFSTKMLRWLMAHLWEINGKKTCDIVTQFLVNEVNWKDPAAFQQWLADSSHDELYGHCYGHLFNSKEAEKYKDSTSTFLALMICLGGSFKLILKLFDEGVDLNSRYVMNPIRKKPTPNEEYKAKEPPSFHAQEHQSKLEYAIQNRNTPMVQALLACRADINHCDDDGQTALEFAVGSYVRAYEKDRGSERTIIGKQLVVMLLENGADPNFEYYDAFRKTISPSLLCAVESSEPDLHLMQLLLEKGACVDADYEDWCYKYMYEYGEEDGRPCRLISHVLADKRKDLQLKKEIFALLLASGAEYDKNDELCVASESGDIELVRFHLENGADPNWSSEWHDSPLEVCAGAGNIPLVLILLSAGATLSGNDHSLSEAACHGRLDMVALLLQHEKRLEEVEEALKRAERDRFYSVIQLLRQAKANWEA